MELLGIKARGSFPSVNLPNHTALVNIEIVSCTYICQIVYNWTLYSTCKEIAINIATQCRSSLHLIPRYPKFQASKYSTTTLPFTSERCTQKFRL